jgi:hypothetical protein
MDAGGKRTGKEEAVALELDQFLLVRLFRPCCRRLGRSGRWECGSRGWWDRIAGVVTKCRVIYVYAGDPAQKLVLGEVLDYSLHTLSFYQRAVKPRKIRSCA